MGIHDQLFKQLLSRFCWDFIFLFIPTLAKYLTNLFLEDGDKEIFDIFGHKESNHVDVIKNAKDRDGHLQFVIHIEAQAQPQERFADRMFRYYARLQEQYSVPVFPIALFSFKYPKSKQAAGLKVGFADLPVLDFRFNIVQLNRLDWRDYKDNPNPVAIAFLPKMKIGRNERHLVKLNCEKMLAKLNIDEEGTRLVGKFLEVYLPLSATELEQYKQEFDKMTQPEKEEIMELYTSWELKGLKQGRIEGFEQGCLEGKRQILLELLADHIQNLNEHVVGLVHKLSEQQLKEFGQSIPALNSLAEAEEWLARKVIES